MPRWRVYAERVVGIGQHRQIPLSPMQLYVTHEHFARRVNPYTSYADAFRAWYVGQITPGLIP